MVRTKEQGLHYAITHTSPTSVGRSAPAVAVIRRWAEAGVNFVQLREKTLKSGDLLRLAQEAMHLLAGPPGARPRLLVNGRADVAAAAGAHGVHLTARPGELHPQQARTVFRAAGLRECFVSVSCHDVDAVRRARKAGADLVLFGPVFEKRVGGEPVVAGLGLDSLRAACEAGGAMPVLALGGVTEANAAACWNSGAAGIAGIRLFAWPQPGDEASGPHEKIEGLW